MAEATIRDVAALAGVSVATVSRVINSAPGVREDTIRKVVDAVGKTGYVPNINARNLKTEESKMIGLVVSRIENPHFSAMAEEIEKILWKHGYSLVVCSTKDDPSQERDYLRRLMGMRVDGLILNTTGMNGQYIADMSRQLPIVLVDRNVPDAGFVGDLVTSNGFSGMRAIVRHLISFGHRDIGIINSNLQVSTGYERLRGFISAMRDIGVEVDDSYPYRYNCAYFNESGGAEGCGYLMGLAKPPTAIIVSNNTMALGVYKHLKINGFHVPRDVSVVSYGNIQNSELFAIRPSYTTLNPQFIGSRAAEHLLSRIESPKRGNREVIFEPMLITGDSAVPLQANRTSHRTSE